MITALFEDEDYYKNFLSITYTRPIFECRSGKVSVVRNS